ncbi:unnamed protein product [Chrysodeixis includens]|uniref:Peptidase S1 domain-containing protein n=1 Tax=Chrysodeixis includens TaxID=689277 RepID=A0A9P0BNQ6_CHRIL|nr:unnamed protein product [Chrysodeixis includens]
MVSLAAWSVLLLAGLSAVAASGSPAVIEQFPSTVQIEIGYRHAWVQYCVGNLITGRHVLTVAHCTSGPVFDPRILRVRAGATYRGRDGVVNGVDSVKNHPNFNIRKGFTYDASIIRVDGYFYASPAINTVSIAAPGVYFPDNVPVTVAAWGRTTQDQLWADRELRSNILYTVNRHTCQERYTLNEFPIDLPDSIPIPQLPELPDLPIEIPDLPITIPDLPESIPIVIPDDFFPISLPITETMLCTRLPNEDGQNLGIRDGGSPLFYQNILVGMVSFGLPVGNSRPLVATDVSHLSNWIVQNVD